MSYLLLHNDAVAQLFAAGPLVPPRDCGHLTRAVDLLAAAQSLHAATEARAREAEARGQAEGHARGLAEGHAEAELAHSSWLFDAHLALARDRAAQRAEMVHVTIGAIRRIAGAVAADALVAGLAERAIAELAPAGRLIVRVAPGNAATVRTRLAALPAVVVEADPDVAATDCMIETPQGRTLAGLEVQLQTLARRWATLSTADRAAATEAADA